MRVLIADDDPLSRRVLRRAVEKLGHRCLAARDGEEAWSLYLEAEPDVVISDWMMPRLDGINLCRRVRADGDEAYTYFVLLTARGDNGDRLTGMQAGADDYLTKPLDPGDLQLRLIAAQRVTALHRKLLEQAHALRQMNREFYRDGRQDHLTGVGNRRRLDEDLERLHRGCEQAGLSYSVALVDIDEFKRYNDTCGHPAGDEALRNVAATLRMCCRGRDAVYRYGGEEFMVVFPETAVEDAARAVDRLRREVRAQAIPHPGRSTPGPLTVSAGVAGWAPPDSESSEAVVQRADEALYQAKQSGRNRVCTSPASPLEGGALRSLPATTH
ncbi:MAG: GGDEF domain-containing response regulator [Myxococcota bacterium]